MSKTYATIGKTISNNRRQVNAIIGSGWDAMAWVPEGQRSGPMSYSTSNKSSTYVTLGEEDAITVEAINASRNFEDLQATMAFRLLQKMMLKEEIAILGGNATLNLGTPGTPTVSAVTNTSSTLPTGTYKVKVVALTLEGYLNSSVAGGVATTKSITSAGAAGGNFTLNGGSSNVSPESSGQAVTVSTTALGMSVTAITGAVAYAWYISSAGGTGDETLQAITTTNWCVFSTALTASTQAATAVTADHSSNPNYAYDGLLTTAFKAGSNAYVNVLPTGTVGTGTTLTASGRGSVSEIDTMFQSMWDNFQVSPSVLYVNSQELKNITNKVLSNSSGPLVRYENNAEGGDAYHITASGVVEYLRFRWLHHRRMMNRKIWTCYGDRVPLARPVGAHFKVEGVADLVIAGVRK